ncbi:MAG TPA: DUF6629 family protein, partial [Urbifossiella sp.]|nr:DUF6629 family protein [Urbifossiella sp.]
RYCGLSWYVWNANCSSRVSDFCLSAVTAGSRLSIAAPFLLGVQQVFEGGVWVGVGRGDPALTRDAAAGLLFLVLVVWPIWMPLAAAALEDRGRRRTLFLGFAGLGVAAVGVYSLPVAAAGGAGPHVVGQALRYDLPAPGPVWPAVYLAAVCVPLAGSRAPRVQPLGWLVLTVAAVAYATSRETFLSAWGCLAAATSAYIAYVLYRLPDPRPEIFGTGAVVRPL